jgi:uncharacterized membrane protein
MGGVVSLRDAQVLTGKPRKVTMYAVRLRDLSQAEAVVAKINRQFPEAYAALSGDFTEQMPDYQNSNGMMGGISFVAILVGGVGVLNTMLMAVFERTREIGVLRALGWRRRAVLQMILSEALLLGLLGGVVGIATAFSDLLDPVACYRRNAPANLGGMFSLAYFCGSGAWPGRRLVSSYCATACLQSKPCVMNKKNQRPTMKTSFHPNLHCQPILLCCWRLAPLPSQATPRLSR